MLGTDKESNMAKSAWRIAELTRSISNYVWKCFENADIVQQDIDGAFCLVISDLTIGEQKVLHDALRFRYTKDIYGMAVTRNHTKYGRAIIVAITKRED